MTEHTSLTHHFLTAMPGMDDPYFFHAVAYICEHTADGAVGIMINRPIEFTLGQVFGQVNITCADPEINNIPVLFGGPLQQQRGFVIHSPAGHWRSSVIVADDIAITTSRDILEAIAERKGPDNMIIALGYSSWGAGQLEQELSQNLWLTGPVSSEVLFNIPFENRWAAAAALLGIDITLLSQDIGHG